MPDLCSRDDHLRKCIRQLQNTTILDVKPYLASSSREGSLPQIDQLPVVAELRTRLLQDDFLAQLSEDVLKSFSTSEMRGKQRAESLASQVYRIQQRILDDSEQSDHHGHGFVSGQASPQRSPKRQNGPKRSSNDKSLVSPEISASPRSDDHPIFSGEFDKRVKQLQIEQSQHQASQEPRPAQSSLLNAAKCNTLAELAATRSLNETVSLCATLLYKQSDLDLYGILENLYSDRDTLRRTLAKTSDGMGSQSRLLKTRLRDNEKLIQACLMALQQRNHESGDTQLSASQYIKSYIPEDRSKATISSAKQPTPKVTTTVRPSTASLSYCGEKLIPEQASAAKGFTTISHSSPYAPNDLYNGPSSVLFPILAQSRLRQSLRQSRKPFGEGCAYLPSKSTTASNQVLDATDKDCDQGPHHPIGVYNEQVEDVNDCYTPMFSNCTAPPITHTNAMQLHALMFSPHAMKAFAAGSNIVKLVCPDSLALNQSNCRYIGNIVEPLLLLGSTVINVSLIHSLRERLAKCFFYEPDGLLISPMERNFVWATLCFVLYKHPDAIFIPRNGNLLQAAQFILPFDVALKPTHVLLEVTIVAPSLPLKSYAIANVAVPYFNDKPALPRATRIEALSKYQRRIYFSIDRMRFALNKATRVLAAYLKKTTDVLE